MKIKLINTDIEIVACFNAMQTLRPHLKQEAFVTKVKRQQKQAYQLAYIVDNEEVKCIAGFRILENMSIGKYLYVDDLSTVEHARSNGYGNAMLDWLIDYAKQYECEQLRLDSGVTRHDAHRFYFRHGMHIHAHHFKLVL